MLFQQRQQVSHRHEHRTPTMPDVRPYTDADQSAGMPRVAAPPTSQHRLLACRPESGL